MDLSDVPVVGGAVGGLLDLVLHGGDTLVWLGLALIEHVDLVVPVLSILNRLAERTAWLPADLIEQALMVALAALLATYALRLVNGLGSDS